MLIAWLYWSGKLWDVGGYLCGNWLWQIKISDKDHFWPIFWDVEGDFWEFQILPSHDTQSPHMFFKERRCKLRWFSPIFDPLSHPQNFEKFLGVRQKLRYIFEFLTIFPHFSYILCKSGKRIQKSNKAANQIKTYLRKSIRHPAKKWECATLIVRDDDLILSRFLFLLSLVLFWPYLWRRGGIGMVSWSEYSKPSLFFFLSRAPPPIPTTQTLAQEEEEERRWSWYGNIKPTN